MAKGDIVLIPFPFTNLNGSKLRPAIILAETKPDLTVCFITSQVDWQESTDILLIPNNQNGLKKQSLIRTSKIATIDKVLIRGLLGKISISEEKELNAKLKIIFNLT